MGKRTEYIKRIRKLGNCRNHINEKVLVDRKYCQKCKDYTKNRRDAIRAGNSCVHHPTAGPVNPKTRRCKICYENNIKKEKERKKLNICTRHVNEKRITNKSFCLLCERKTKERLMKRKIEGMCSKHENVPVHPGFASCAKCLEKGRMSSKRIKEKVLEYYGKRCACCGESTFEFLTVDHINNDGAKHRRETKGISRGGTPMLAWLIKNNFPDGFQILCFNCNCGGKKLGICPHQKKENII